MQKNHIIFAGCSFSDEGVYEDNFNVELLKNTISYQTLRIPTTIKIHKYFALDLINENKIDDVKIYTIARGSYGNHVIFDKLKQKIIDIKSKYPNDKIYALIQLSALLRPAGKMNNMDIDINDYPYDYGVENLKDYESIKNTFLKHISNIENINDFCKQNNVINKIFFGWANLFMEDFIEYDLIHKVETLKKIVDFYKYNDADDEIQTYCAGKKPKLNSKLIFGLKTYNTTSGEFGGISEYARDNLSIGRRYNLITDPHPNSHSYYIFYKNIIKKWFIDNNILSDTAENLENIILFTDVFHFEYIKFMNTLNIPQSDNELISDVSWEILLKNKLEDVEFVTNSYKVLNNKYLKNRSLL
jgi:hypothetical protein